MAANQSLAQGLAERIVSFDTNRVTRRAVRLAKTAIIDTIGVTLAGAAEPAVAILLATPGVADGNGTALVFGTNRRTSALDATLVNGTASHALDYDDVSGVMGGHPSVPIVPPLFALGETLKVSGRRLIDAYVVGFEVESRIARAVNFHHYDKGWHPTATLGVFGAAAASAHLLGLDAGRTATAIALAASLAAGIKANFGTMTKPLHVGHCARNGLLAALLAERGFTANVEALEQKQGFLTVFNGAGNYDAERMLADWASPLEIEDDGVGLKQFPCCGSTHPAVAAMLDLVRLDGLTASQAAQIEILTHRRRLPHTDNPDPKSPLGAKFSIQYATARALIDGALRLGHFEGEAHKDPEARRLLAMTTARPHPAMTDDQPNQFAAEVIVTTTDGRKLSRKIDHLIGRGPSNPMSEDELWEKFSDCAHRVLPRDQVAPLFERLDTLDTVDDINQATRLVELRGLPAGDALQAAPAAAAHAPQPQGETAWVP